MRAGDARNGAAGDARDGAAGDARDGATGDARDGAAGDARDGAAGDARDDCGIGVTEHCIQRGNKPDIGRRQCLDVTYVCKRYEWAADGDRDVRRRVAHADDRGTGWADHHPD